MKATPAPRPCGRLLGVILLTFAASCAPSGQLPVEEVAKANKELAAAEWKKVSWAGAAIELDRLPDGFLGRWGGSTTAEGLSLVVGRTLIVKVAHEVVPGETLYVSDAYEFVARLESQYLIGGISAGRAFFCTMELVDGVLIVGTLVDNRPISSLNEVASREWSFERWSRPVPPTGAEPWAGRASWKADRLLREVHLLDATKMILQLAHWPFQSIEVADVFSVPYRMAVDIVVVYQRGGETRHWSSVITPGSLSISDKHGGPLLEPPHRRNGVGVHPLLAGWAKEVVLPQLPRE